MAMGRRVSLVTMLLVAASRSLTVGVLLLQLPPLASSLALPRFKFNSPAASQQLKNTAKDFFRDQALDFAAQNLQPPSPPGSPSGGSQVDNAPATTYHIYQTDLVIGVPPQTVSGVVLDISTQLVWTQCTVGDVPFQTPTESSFQARHDSMTGDWLLCSSNYCQQVFGTHTCNNFNDPYKGRCAYYTAYGGTTTTTGILANDTFILGGTPVPGMIFGCSITRNSDYSGVSGVIGLGRGPLSLVSQLGLSNFSYYLAPDDSDRNNEFSLGDVAVPQTGRSRTTRFQINTAAGYSERYYVRLIGIQVDGEELDTIPAGTFDLRNDGSGGVFLSTTVPVTYLLEDAYRVVRQAFASRIQAQPVVDDDAGGSPVDAGLKRLCYTAQSLHGVDIPRLTLVFDGEDATMELRTSNYFFEFNDGERDLECLSVLPSVGASLLGTLLQTGTTMIYDLAGEQLTFVMEDPPQSPASLATESRVPLLSTTFAMVVAVAVWVRAAAIGPMPIY